MKKSRYWTSYSIKQHDLLADSGTASHELKLNGCAYACSIVCLGLACIFPPQGPLTILAGIAILNLLINRKLFQLFFKAGGTGFAVKAIGYYLLVYPLPVLQGSLVGIKDHFLRSKNPSGIPPENVPRK